LNVEKEYTGSCNARRDEVCKYLWTDFEIKGYGEEKRKIDLKSGTTPPFSPLYNISIEELRVLHKFLVEIPDHVP